MLSTIDNVDAYVDPWLTPPDFLDWLAGWFGLELDATWPEERRRALVANALELGRWRGTVIGLALLVELYTGAPAEIDDGGDVVASDDPIGAAARGRGGARHGALHGRARRRRCPAPATRSRRRPSPPGDPMRTKASTVNADGGDAHGDVLPSVTTVREHAKESVRCRRMVMP